MVVPLVVLKHEYDQKSGLVASWRMDESSGTTANDNVNGLDATLSGGASWVSGKFGNALGLDGINGCAYKTDTALLDLSTGITISGWVYLDTLIDYNDLVRKESAYILQWDSTGKLRPHIYANSQYYIAEGTAGDVWTGEWIHVAMTYDTTTHTIYGYVNGEEVCSYDITTGYSINDSASSLFIGCSSGTSEFVDGKIDEVRIYNRALTEAEIIEEYRGIKYFEVSIQKSAEKLIDELKCEAIRTITFAVGDEIECWVRDTKVFGGYVSEQEDKLIKKEISALSYGNVLTDRTINFELYDDKSPEYIAEDLITKYTDFTYASTSSSGVVLDSYVATGNLLEALTELATTLGWVFKTDANKNFYFQPSLTETSTYVATVGSGCVSDVWNRVLSKIVNEVYVAGSNNTVSTSDYFEGTGSQTEFVLTYMPYGSVKVSVDFEEQTSGTDYTVDVATKTVNFVTAPNSGADVVVDYSWNNTVFIKHADSTSQATYGVKSKILTASWIQTMEDAQEYAEGYVGLYKDPLWSGRLILGGLQDSISDNVVIGVVDGFEGIDEDMVIKSITWAFPQATTTIEVGTYIPILFDWQRETVSRIADLQDRVALFSTLAVVFKPVLDVITNIDTFESDLGKGFIETMILYDTLIAQAGKSFMGSQTILDTDTLALQVNARTDVAYTDSVYYTT